MLALLAAFLISLSGARAQSNTEYSFRQQLVTDGQGFGGNGDPVPVLSMDCLAANGYGQWTLSSQLGQGGEGSGATTYPVGWFLLANGLYAPSTHYAAGDLSHFPGCIPPGVVQNASMEAVPNPKATANLDGSVNYVSPAGGMFNIEWIGPSDVDLSLSFLSSPSPTTMNVVNTTGVSPAPHALTAPTSAHPVVIEADFRDEFDVCSDASYLYIVWEYMNTGTGIKEIWITALTLGTSTAVFGPVKVDNGSYPTITCDPRNNRGGGAPKFDIAYIDPTGTLVKTAVYNAGFTISTLDNHFWDPGVAGPPGQKDLYTSALHARIVRSSVLGQPSTLGVYAIVATSQPSLIYYSPNGTGTAANYVAGYLWKPPTPISQTPPFPRVHDAPIIAFANPYDNQSGWQKTDQIHCLYQYDLGASHSPRYPIAIVRGSDIAAMFPVEPDPSNAYTNLIINQSSGALMSDPSGNLGVPFWYVGAVNQMGIHVHWHALDIFSNPTHYYARDFKQTTADGHYSRAFDEPIDENTLVTDQCNVTNGTAHGGTAGAAITGAIHMTVWTDPNYGSPYLYGTTGLYQPLSLTSLNPYVGTINFPEADTKLYVGDGSTDPDGMPYQSTLAVMPFFYFNFMEPYAGDTDGRGVTVRPNSVFDYYGLNATHDGTGAITGIQTAFTDGTADGIGAGTIDLEGDVSIYGGLPVTWYATMNVHGGANFYMGPDNYFRSHDGISDFLYQPDIYPINSSTNPSNSGLMTVLGSAIVDSSGEEGNYPVYSGTPPVFLKQYIIRVTSSTISGFPSAFPQWTSTANFYSNRIGGGVSKVRIEGNPGGAGTTASFISDYLDGVVISGSDMHSSMNIYGCTFANSIDPAIWLEQPSMTATYGIQFIENNTFGYDEVLSTDALYSDQVYGVIELQNFYASDFSWLQITGNFFTTNNGQSSEAVSKGLYRVGIFSWASNATIMSNVITASKYDHGIIDYGDGAISDLDQTLICSNTVKNTPYSPGIETFCYSGYVKLNEIAFCAVGYLHQGYGTSNFVFNNVHDNQFEGIDVDGDLDMSGVHHTPPNASSDDLPAYNTVKNNGLSSPYYQSQIVVATAAETGTRIPYLWLGQGSNEAGTSQYNYTAFGDNNIEKGSDGSTTLITGGSSGGTNNIARSIDNNYWGGRVPNTSGTGYWPSFFYLTPVINYSSEYHISDIQVSCGNDSGTLSKEGHDRPLSQLVDTTLDSCDWAEAMAQNYSGHQQWRPAYDTMRWFFEHCYTENMDGLDGDWNDIFGPIEGGILKGAPADSVLAMRNWLLSVRNLNPNGSWWCDVVGAIEGTYFNTFDRLAIVKFLIDNPHCPQEAILLNRIYKGMMSDTISIWAQTDPNPNTDKFDSTLPTLHDLGLDSLLDDVASGVIYTTQGSQIILDARITTNPFPQASSVFLSIGREAYLNISVFDLLGRLVEDAGYAGVFEQGSREIPLDMSNAPPGAYYIRISTANNEVRTLKITKE